MALNAEHEGDPTKIPGTMLAVSRKCTGEFVGLCAFTSEGAFVRRHASWVIAKGVALSNIVVDTDFVKMGHEFIDIYDKLDCQGKIPSAAQITAGSIAKTPDSSHGQGQPSLDNPVDSRPATIPRAWKIASRIIGFRPWLEVSMMCVYGEPDHLVVHDGPEGAALHFDRDEGPTWEPKSVHDQEFGWDDVDNIDGLGALHFEMEEHWGAPAPAPEITAKGAVFTLIAHLLDHNDTGGRWTVRQARLVHYTDESAAAPDSAFSLTADFRSLAPTVQWYIDQMASPSWGEGTIWHEPLWLVERDDHPRLVLDEAGRVHMTADTISEVLSMWAAAADLGGIDDPYSFDLLESLPHVGGDFAGLAALLRQGMGATLRAIKPKKATTAVTGMTIPSDTTTSGEVEDPLPTEDRFPHECSDVQDFNTALLRWLSRTPPGATLGQSHDTIVTTVPIGGEQCLLHGESTREGITTYLEAALGGSASFFAAPSTTNVVHRVTVGRGPARIPGFYLYTRYPHSEPGVFAYANGSVFGWRQIAFRLFDAIASLHAAGHQRLHVLPSEGDLGWHFRVILAEDVTYDVDDFPEAELRSTIFEWSSAYGVRVGTLAVMPDTPVSSLAKEILAHATDKGVGTDWAYAGWFSALLATAHRFGELPVCECASAWRLRDGTGIFLPPPPVGR